MTVNCRIFCPGQHDISIFIKLSSNGCSNYWYKVHHHIYWKETYFTTEVRKSFCDMKMIFEYIHA